jgi:hypothetical protein
VKPPISEKELYEIISEKMRYYFKAPIPSHDTQQFIEVSKAKQHDFVQSSFTCAVYIHALSYVSKEHLEEMETFYRLLCGGFAGLVANTQTYPLDLIRARVTIATSEQNYSAY